MSSVRSKSKSKSTDIATLTDSICERLAKNLRVRRTLPARGRLRIDRQLPFLVIYRTPPNKDIGTKELVTSEASYLFASGKEEYHDQLTAMCQRIAATMQEHFGTFLFLEIWSREDDVQSAQEDVVDELPILKPAFEVVSPDTESLPSTLDAFTDALAQITISEHAASVTSCSVDAVSPPGMKPMQLACHQEMGGCVSLGLAVRPIYRDSQSGALFPIVLRTLRSQLAWALRKGISQFTGYEKSKKNRGYHSLGPTAMVKASRLVDQQLCEVSESFDFLLQVTPVNSDEAWSDFKANDCQPTPTLRYRPLPYNPSLLKRALFDIELERIEDPTLGHLFREKQEEIDRQLTALQDLDSPRFLYSSLQLFGPADDNLVALAKEILARFPTRTRKSRGEDCLDVATVVARARDEIDHYHQQMNEFNAKVELCNHIASGIMVSQDRLLISDTLKLPTQRAAPLLHHEIGTHLLTYFNGRTQPFRQLYAGLAGYDELQEGLAVLAEYLTGGLTENRLRTLAGRVIAARLMTDGEPFAATFARLHQNHGFARKQAFTTTLRAYRGGGFTKDVIYLRGLRDLLEYLAGGHDIEPLYVGKFGLPHLPYIQEMRRRGVIQAAGVLPRFLHDPKSRERLDACRGSSVLELMETQR